MTDNKIKLGNQIKVLKVYKREQQNNKQFKDNKDVMMIFALYVVLMITLMIIRQSIVICVIFQYTKNVMGLKTLSKMLIGFVLVVKHLDLQT